MKIIKITNRKSGNRYPNDRVVDKTDEFRSKLKKLNPLGKKPSNLEEKD